MDPLFRVSADGALAQRTRARLFSLLEELGRPAGTAELAERVGLHPNGVRVHLGRMQRAGLLVRVRSPQGPGRPADRWTIAPAARTAASPTDVFVDLSRWLARALSPGRAGRIEQTGREIGRELAQQTGPESAPAPVADLTALEALCAVFGARGFRPEVEDADGDGAQGSIRLGSCPFRDAVRENQPAICTLHRGITLGLVQAVSPDARVAEFTPRDPDSAGCTITITGR